MSVVMGVDPGETTGFAIVHKNDTDEGSHISICGEWYGMDELDECIDNGLFEEVDVIAIERYIIYPNRAVSHIGDQLYTAQEIGRIKWIAHKRSIIVEEQSASMAKQRWPDSRLSAHGFNVSGASPHRLDALRHALTYIERHKL